MSEGRDSEQNELTNTDSSVSSTLFSVGAINETVHEDLRRNGSRKSQTSNAFLNPLSGIPDGESLASSRKLKPFFVISNE